jgi:hypothetical protein
MPWDGTELWEAGFSVDAGLSDIRKVVGGVAESIFQPEWSPEGILHYISDRSGWWNLYSKPGPLKTMDARSGSISFCWISTVFMGLTHRQSPALHGCANSPASMIFIWSSHKWEHPSFIK